MTATSTCASRPMRWAAGSRGPGSARPPRTAYCSGEEIMDVSGDRDYASSAADRGATCPDYWLERRPSMPRWSRPEVGREANPDQIFKAEQPLPAGGEAVGSHTSRSRRDRRARLEGRRPVPLVSCTTPITSTSSGGQPCWCAVLTELDPAFAKIAACVCDGIGTLSHAAIVSAVRHATVTAVGLVRRSTGRTR